MAGMSRKEFKKRFPNLARELENGVMRISIEAVRTDAKEGEKAVYSLKESAPTAIDFLRRCENEEQAEKTIDYLESKEDISKDYADRLRKQLREKGLRSFGSFKRDGHYLEKMGYG
ncbi:MAG: DUF2095 family protein [Candidatus Bathyarchaeia archaeon]